MVSTSPKAKQFAEIVYLLHGATTKDRKYKHGLEAIFKGFTSSHAGALLRFTDQDLFNKYVKDSGIPYSITHENGQDVYAVEINFGPDGAAGIGDTKKKGILYSQIEATLSSNFLTPVVLTKKGKELLGDKNVVRSRILPFFKRTINLGITTSIHENLVPKKFKENASPDEIHDALEQFAKALEIAEAKHIKKPDYDDLMSSVNHAFVELKKVLAPDPEISMAHFKGEVDKFITIGTPAEQTITIPLSTAGSSTKVLPLERMLQFLVAPKNFEAYNLLLNNCAHFLRNMYLDALKDDPELAKVFHNDFFSEENILGWLASVVSPHSTEKDLNELLDTSTPVLLGRMLSDLKSGVEAKVAMHNKAHAINNHFKTSPELQPRQTNVAQKVAKLTPHYVLNVFTTALNNVSSSFSQHRKEELDVVKIASKICENLKETLNVDVVMEQVGKNIVILDPKQNVVAVASKEKDQFHFECYSQNDKTADAIAKAIHAQLKLQDGERYNFNLVTDPSVGANAGKLVGLIQKEYQDSNPNVHVKHGHP